MTDDLLNVINFEDVLSSDCNYIDLNETTKSSKFNNFIVSHLNIHSLPDKYD